jgi:hypothetical protein
VAQLRKVMTITLEIELGDRKQHGDRLSAAYDAAVEAAVQAAEQQLLESSIEKVTTRMTWDYRFAEKASERTLSPDEFPDDEDGVQYLGTA